MFRIKQAYCSIDELEDDGGACGTFEGKRNANRVLVRKLQGNREYRRTSSRCEGSVKMILNEIRRRNVDCINLAEDREKCRAVISMSMNHRVTLKYVECTTNWVRICYVLKKDSAP